MDEKTRLEARELLLRSRIYRYIALGFGALGLLVFVILYFKHIDGDIMHALKRPSLILIIVIPFLPAFILTRMSIKAEKKLGVLIKSFEKTNKTQ